MARVWQPLDVRSIAAPVLAVCLVGGGPAHAGSKPLTIAPSALVQSTDVWTEGLRAGLPEGPLQDKVVGVKIGLEGPVTVVARASMREPADPHADAAGSVSVTVGASRHPGGFRKLSVAVEGVATLDPATQALAQNFTGTLSWTLHDGPKIASKLQVSSNVSIDVDKMEATPSAGPEWISVRHLNGNASPMRSDLIARLNYRVTPGEPLDFTAKLELRMTPRAP